MSVPKIVEITHTYIRDFPREACNSIHLMYGTEGNSAHFVE